ncbi:MAG: hypothetical protein JWM20_585 [Patescibacteria group bacterium]|nr:hypothetical protein [Patescibacteria group bacterium]
MESQPQPKKQSLGRKALNLGMIGAGLFLANENAKGQSVNIGSGSGSVNIGNNQGQVNVRNPDGTVTTYGRSSQGTVDYGVAQREYEARQEAIRAQERARQAEEEAARAEERARHAGQGHVVTNPPKGNNTGIDVKEGETLNIP